VGFPIYALVPSKNSRNILFPGLITILSVQQCHKDLSKVAPKASYIK